MIEYSHQNSLVFGYDGGLLNERRTMNAELTYTFERCTRVPLAFPLELIETAKLMQRAACERPIYLLQSGGMDSEVMIKSFKAAKVPFKTITFRLPHGQNEHELQFVREFSEREDLSTEYFDFDLLQWLKTAEARELFHETHCHGSSMLPHMKLIEQVAGLGGMPVLGGGDIVIIKDRGRWMYSKYEHMLPWYWFCAKKNIAAGVAFFQHTPETTLSALLDSTIAKAASGGDALANALLPDLRQVKYRMYHKHWPDLRKRIKFGGSELIYHHVLAYDAKWRKERSLQYDAIWSKSYAEVVRDLRPLEQCTSFDGF